MAQSILEQIFMDRSTILSCVIIAAVTVYVVREFWSWYRLRHIPGPFAASIWRGWMLRHTLTGQLNYELKKVTDQYGEPTHHSACMQDHFGC